MTSSPHDKVALTVVRFLGAATLVFGSGVIFLVWSATQYDGIDPSTVALVAGVSTLAGSAMGALGSILASTGKGAPTATQPVEVVNTPADPVPTAPTEPVETYRSEFGYSAVEWLLLLAAGTALGIVAGTLLLRHLG